MQKDQRALSHRKLPLLESHFVGPFNSVLPTLTGSCSQGTQAESLSQVPALPASVPAHHPSTAEYWERNLKLSTG